MHPFFAKIKSFFFEDVPEQAKPQATDPQTPIASPKLASYAPSFDVPLSPPLLYNDLKGMPIVQNNDTSEAIVIACYFNPMKSPYRLRGFKKFYEGIKHYNHKIIECSIGDSKLELHDFVPAENYVSTHTKSLLWHKETLLNNLIKTLPVNFKYIFWLDADVLFTNKCWLEDSVGVMKNGANMVQPFEYGIHLEKDHLSPNFNVNAYRRQAMNPITRNKMMWRSFCSNNDTGTSKNMNYDIHGHVGFAWGIKRDVLDRVSGGLYDKALIGGADHIMAHAGAGHINHSCITKSFTEDINAINDWSKSFYAAVQGKLGYVSGDLYHIWHGDLQDRQYLKRIREFAPASKRIHERDENGFYIGDDDDSDYMLAYFMMREAMADVDDWTDPMIDNYGTGQIIDQDGDMTPQTDVSDTNYQTYSPTLETDLPAFTPNTISDNDLPGFIPNSDNASQDYSQDNSGMGSTFS